jgi:5'-methylthioadenosine phosphorylase
MRERIAPLDLVIPDQFYDNTKRRILVLPGGSSRACRWQLVCPDLAEALRRRRSRPAMSPGGTYRIEGPQFSTKAESRIYRSWGVDVIGMTNVPEVKLAREAELCYATLALVTDYDVWHASEAEVTVEAVVANLLKNVATAKSVLRRAIPRLHGPRSCPCPGLLRNAVITSPAAFPDSARRRLDLLIGKYFPPTPPAPTARPRRPAAPLRARHRRATAKQGTRVARPPRQHAARRRPRRSARSRTPRDRRRSSLAASFFTT